jgi:hypothetical protein
MKKKTKKNKSVSGSHPEENYVQATRKNLYLDRPMSIGGWPEGEYDPPIQDRLVSWYKSMGMMETFVREVLQSSYDI